MIIEFISDSTYGVVGRINGDQFSVTTITSRDAPYRNVYIFTFNIKYINAAIVTDIFDITNV